MATKYLTFGSVIVLWLTVTCGSTFAILPYPNPTTGNYLVTCLIVFNNLNLFVALTEICLGYEIAFIQLHYGELCTAYHGDGREWCAVVKLLTDPLTPRQLLSPRTYAKMWSTYALFDPSYQNRKSFGFFIDVGNGWSTLSPCVMLNVGMVRPGWVDPLWVGCVTIAAYWQMLYGTLIYLLSFLMNRRYEGFEPLSIGLFVVFTNAIWIFFPGMAIYAAVCILRDGNMDLFQGTVHIHQLLESRR